MKRGKGKQKRKERPKQHCKTVHTIYRSRQMVMQKIRKKGWSQALLSLKNGYDLSRVSWSMFMALFQAVLFLAPNVPGIPVIGYCPRLIQ